MGPLRLFVLQGPSGSSSEECRLVFPCWFILFDPATLVEPAGVSADLQSEWETPSSNTNLYFGKLSADSDKISSRQLWDGRSEAPGRTAAPPARLSLAEYNQWHDIKNKKWICLRCSRLPAIKRRPFKQRTVAVARRLWPSFNATAAGTSLRHPCFLTWYALKNGFPPQCTTMMWEAGARASACCDVNLMTSCCSGQVQTAE